MLIAILGWLGAGVILAGYGAFSLGRLPNGPLYQLTNLVGAICISMNVAAHGAYPSAIVNGVWAVIAAFVLIRMARGPAARRRADAAAAVAVASVVALDEQNERRIHAAELESLAPSTLSEAVPLVTAALAVVALAAAQQEPKQESKHEPSGAVSRERFGEFAQSTIPAV